MKTSDEAFAKNSPGAERESNVPERWKGRSEEPFVVQDARIVRDPQSKSK